MKFLIQNKVNLPENPKSSYEIAIEVMQGDGDFYKTIYLGSFPEDKMDWLQDAVETCDRMIARYPRGMGGYDDYDDVPGWAQWFGYETFDGYDEEKEDIHFEWPSYEGMAYQILSYNVYYYDENRQKHHVKVEKGDK